MFFYSDPTPTHIEAPSIWPFPRKHISPHDTEQMPCLATVELRTLCSRQFGFSSRSEDKLKRKIFAFLPAPGPYIPDPSAKIKYFQGASTN